VVPTHNDGANIGPLLRRLLDEPCVGEVVVVASGCDDDTVPVATRVAATAPGRVAVYVEVDRSGKTAAVNFGVGRCTQPWIVIVSGDVLPEPGAIKHLLVALYEPGVGMTGGRPVPVNGDSSIVGTAVHLLWTLHHRLALGQPKLGEMVALRADAAAPLPPTSVDEACFQARIEAAGWTCRYVPTATVANRGPSTLRDFIKQRRQIHTGHLWLRRRERYTVPSLRTDRLLREYWAELRSEERVRRVRYGLRTVVAVSLELWSRVLARLDYVRGRERHVWDMVESAKDPALGPHGVGARHR
jgi:glycosyltransferase involved in cell wall biosynthesis